ncbi:MAG: hypothetical protein JKY19_14415 [Alcanivoracaceae bacterium]|nr:hypothetical protein [Alcanivoracaceae bacterium]
MPVVAQINKFETLRPEWQRVEILAQCLLESRSGKKPSDNLIQHLQDSQQQIEFLRKGNSWHKLTVDSLPDMALDILACTYAPLINPDVALLFQDLQQGNSIHPTLAFLHRLLALSEQEYHNAQQLLGPEGVLVRKNLISVKGQGPMVQLQPHNRILPLITGLPQQPLHIPGAIQIKNDFT